MTAAGCRSTRRRARAAPARSAPCARSTASRPFARVGSGRRRCAPAHPQSRPDADDRCRRRGRGGVVIAIDGNAGRRRFRCDDWRMGPAMRVDLLVRAPKAGPDASACSTISRRNAMAAAELHGRRSDRPRARPFDPRTALSRRTFRVPIPTTRRAAEVSRSAPPRAPSPRRDADLPPDDRWPKSLLDSLCTRANALLGHQQGAHGRPTAHRDTAAAARRG